MLRALSQEGSCSKVEGLQTLDPAIKSRTGNGNGGDLQTLKGAYCEESLRTSFSLQPSYTSSETPGFHKDSGAPAVGFGMALVARFGASAVGASSVRTRPPG